MPFFSLTHAELLTKEKQTATSLGIQSTNTFIKMEHITWKKAKHGIVGAGMKSKQLQESLEACLAFLALHSSRSTECHCSNDDRAAPAASLPELCAD